MKLEILTQLLHLQKRTQDFTKTLLLGEKKSLFENPIVLVQRTTPEENIKYFQWENLTPEENTGTSKILFVLKNGKKSNLCTLFFFLKYKSW